jgi:hypothetical protein
MSDEVTAIVITIAILALIIAWVPFLDLVCLPCGRFLEWRRCRKDTAKERFPRATVRHEVS